MSGIGNGGLTEFPAPETSSYRTIVLALDARAAFSPRIRLGCAGIGAPRSGAPRSSRSLTENALCTPAMRDARARGDREQRVAPFPPERARPTYRSVLRRLGFRPVADVAVAM